MFHVVRRVAVIGLALALVSGCGKKKDEEKVVASAGDLKVTIADFSAAHNKITPTNRPDVSTLDGKRRFANDLINKEILLAEAQRLGGISDAGTIEQLDKTFNNRLASILYREEVESKTEVLGKDVAELYEKRKTGVEASHILLPDVATAAKLREEIVSGKISFEDAARKNSLDQSTKERSGSLGVLLWGRSVPTFQKIAFELEPGKVSDPVETEFGVHLIKVAKHVPQEIGTQEQMAPVLRNEARRQKEFVRMKEFVVELETKAKLQWNEDALKLLGDLTEASASLDVDTIPLERQHVPAASEEQRKMVLATFNSGSWTIGNYIDWLQSQPPMNRPLTRLPSAGLKELLRTTQIQNELIVAEAKARGYAERPEAKDEDARIREQILIEVVHARFIQEADVPEEAAKAFFDSTLAANPEVLRIPDRVNMKVLVSMNGDVIRQGLKRIRGGEPEDKVILELSEDSRTKFKGGETGLIARGNYAAELEDVAFKRAAGTPWTDPIVTQTGTGAIKILGREDSRIAKFEDVKDAIMQQLAQSRGEKAFEDWIVKQRETLGVKIYDDVLALLGQSVTGTPAATAPPGGTAPGAAPPAGSETAPPAHDHSHDPPATDSTGTGSGK